MTVAVTHVLNSPGLGGVPRVVEALVRNTDRRRYSPSVFYLKPGDGHDPFPDLGVRTATAGTERGKTGAIVDLAEFLDTERARILHTHSFRPNLYGRMAGALLRTSGLRIVAHYHNDYADKWADPAAITLERRLGRITDARIAVSKAVAMDVAHWTGATPDSITVVPNGLDPRSLADADRMRGRRALALAEGEVCIGLVGRICAQKGIDTFVAAAELLLKEDPTLRFVVAGDDEDRALAERLAHRAAAARPAGAIRLLGHRTDVPDLLAAFDILAAPSRWEGFGLAVIEGMAMGLPVVASAVGGLPEVTNGTARLIPPDDPSALAAELRPLIRDATLRRSQGCVARMRARAFEWPASARLVDGIYDSLMAAP